MRSEDRDAEHSLATGAGVGGEIGNEDSGGLQFAVDALHVLRAPHGEPDDGGRPRVDGQAEAAETGPDLRCVLSQLVAQLRFAPDDLDRLGGRAGCGRRRCAGAVEIVRRDACRLHERPGARKDSAEPAHGLAQRAADVAPGSLRVDLHIASRIPTPEMFESPAPVFAEHADAVSVVDQK